MLLPEVSAELVAAKVGIVVLLIIVERPPSLAVTTCVTIDITAVLEVVEVVLLEDGIELVVLDEVVVLLEVERTVVTARGTVVRGVLVARGRVTGTKRYQ